MNVSNRFKFILLPFLMLSLFQCEKEGIKPPENLIPKQEFVKLMAEFQLVQVMYNLKMDTLRTVAIRDSVLKDYQITLDQFYKSEEYYHTDVTQYQKMLNDAMDMLNEEQSLLLETAKERKK